jgi:peptidoglycan/xylan/chitin deacetylase (PgdA/CDA1 family)
MAEKFGAFVISLDLESLWGVRDHASMSSSYGKNLRGERDAIYQMLEIFEEFAISATWATVGFLFAKNRDELRQFYPQQLPEYTHRQLSPYGEELGENEEQDPYHYGGALLERIARVPRQEIGSHTFSHYYCLEPGQTRSAFQQDLDAAVAIASAKGITLRSMVFPRNQVNAAYLPLLRAAGFTNYRGTEPTWYYRASRNQTASKRGARLADSYLPLSGAQTVRADEVATPSGLANLRSSRFLRPFTPKLRHLDSLRLQRITQQMRHAARVNGMFHLWWHPHNFGCDTAENMAFLRKILLVQRELAQSHQWPSRSMAAATPSADVVSV